MSSHGGPNPFEVPFKFLDKFGVNTTYILAVLGVVFIYFAFSLVDLKSSEIFGYIFTTAPVWLPLLTFLLLHHEWLLMVQKDFDLKQGRITLEIKLPQEVFKSPEAMELVLIQMYQTASPDNHLETYIDGKHPPQYSLELVSRGGEVKMYINTPYKKFKNLIETQLYAQYPGVEVHPLEIDYTAEVPWDPDTYSYMSFHYGLKKADAYPIKTYIEYNMHTMPKEEEKIDPLTSVLEMLGAVGPNQHMWLQILITANRETTFKEGSLSTSPDWKGAARDEIKKIIVAAAKRVGIKEADLKEKGTNMNQLLTDTEKDTIKAIERNLGKLAYNTAIRGIYMAKKEYWNGEMIGAMNSGWRAFDDINRNAIGVRWRTDYDWNWWQDRSGHKRLHMKSNELNEYKRRSYETRDSNLSDSPKVLTTEELATIFHLPGKVATTPTLARIPSKRAEPPSNLPIG